MKFLVPCARRTLTGDPDLVPGDPNLVPGDPVYPYCYLYNHLKYKANTINLCDIVAGGGTAAKVITAAEVISWFWVQWWWTCCCGAGVLISGNRCASVGLLVASLLSSPFDVVDKVVFDTLSLVLMVMVAGSSDDNGRIHDEVTSCSSCRRLSQLGVVGCFSLASPAI